MNEKDIFKQISIVHELIKQLIDILEKESKGCDLIYAKNSIMDLIDYIKEILQSNLGEPVDMGLIRNSFKSMFPPHGGLSDFYIWRDDFEERVRENQKLNSILERLDETLNI